MSTHRTAKRASRMRKGGKSRLYPVNMLIRGDNRDLIDKAADVRGKSRTEFMVEASLREAEDTLLDQTLVRVDKKTYNHFLNVLDRPPSGKGFERLMQASKPWAT